MNLVLSNEEIALLVLHMGIMKKPIQKGLKKVYKSEWKDKFNQYLSCISLLEDTINSSELENESFNINFTEEFVMLHSFINWYVAELNKKENNKSKLDRDAIHFMAILEGIQLKVNILVAS